VVVILIGVGAVANMLFGASLDALAACALVAIAGAIMHRTLARVPENALEYVVGISAVLAVPRAPSQELWDQGITQTCRNPMMRACSENFPPNVRCERDKAFEAAGRPIACGQSG
jgi:hypothetical protein